MPLPHNSDEFFEKKLSVYNRSASAGDVMELPSIYVDSEHTGCDRARCRCSPVPLLPEAAQVIEPTQHTILVPASVPVPVSERPWERDGWCDEQGQCWMGDPGGGGFIPSWRLCRPEDAPSMRVSLPFNALPLPSGEVG